MSKFDQRNQFVNKQINVAIQPDYARNWTLTTPPLDHPPRPASFFGRENEIQCILTELKPGKVVTLTGMGGVGKSVLASEIIWRLSPNFETPMDFPNGIIVHSFYIFKRADDAFLNIINRYEDIQEDEDLYLKAQRILSGKRLLLLLDGAEEADNLHRVLEITGSCGVLVTTRRRSDAGTTEINLETLTESEGISLLRAYGGQYVSDIDAAREIFRLVSGLPLALNIAGRFMRSFEEDVRQYLQFLVESPLSALEIERRKNDSVPYLIERSINRLSDKSRQIVNFMASGDFASITADKIGAALDLTNKTLKGSLKELINVGLIEKRGDGFLLCHQIAYEYIKSKLPAESSKILPSVFSYTTKKTGQTYYLHIRKVTLKNGRKQIIYYFARDVGIGVQSGLPKGYTVVETSRTGLPILRKSVD